VRDIHVYGLNFDWDEEEMDCLTVSGKTWTEIVSHLVVHGHVPRVVEKEDEDVDWGSALKKARVRTRKPHAANARDVLEPRAAPPMAAPGAVVAEPPPDFIEVEEILEPPEAESPMRSSSFPTLFAEMSVDDTRVLGGTVTPIAHPFGAASPVAESSDIEPPPFSEDEGDIKDSDISSVDSSSDSSSGSSSSSSSDRRVARSRRSTLFGSMGWSIAPIYSNKSGVPIQIGWGCVCGQHWNEGDGNECKKQLIYGDQMSPLEAKLRIKLWLVEGLGIDVADTDARSKHLAVKPRKLALLPEGEVDNMAP
jgi:hypothetical protein